MIKLLTLSVLSLFLLTGCLTKELPMQSTYTLAPKALSTQQVLTPVDESIYITTPKTLRNLNTTKIYYVTKQYEQEAYALSKWSNTPAKMLQQAIATKLATEKQYNFVTTTRLQEKASIKIDSELITFEQTINNKDSDVTLHIRAFITHNKKVHSKDFYYTQKAKTNAYGAVTAFNKIVIEFTNELSQYIQTIIKEK